MGGDLSWNSLEIQISNDTKNITLKNPRTLPEETSTILRPQVPPGSSDSCCISDSSDSSDFGGLLVYEAESCTVAIYVYISREQDLNPHVLQLELSLDKGHLGDLQDTCFRMGLGMGLLDPHKNFMTRCQCPKKIEGTVTLNAGPVRVKATVSHGSSCLVKVVLQEWGDSGYSGDPGWYSLLL